MDTPSPILIVGAGPTGLTMAVELLRHGVSCRIIDQALEPSSHSRALGIQARTMEMFDLMGIAERFTARGHQLQGMHITIEGQTQIDVKLAGVDSPYPFILSLAQSETEAILYERLQELGGQVERGVALASFVQNDDDVHATLRHADGHEEQAQAAWLLGCDGAHSVVRHGLGLSFEGERYPETWALADVHLQGDIQQNEGYIYLHHAGLLAILPFGDGRVRLIVETHQSMPDEAVPTLADFQEWLHERALPDATLSDPHWLTYFNIHRRHTPHDRVGRVFLMGDAAHIHSPAGGQGMNTGIQDAVNLAWKLALVEHDHASQTLLRSYEPERQPIAAAVLKMSDQLTKTVMTQNPLVLALRDHLLPLLVHNEFLLGIFASRTAEITYAYRRSPISVDRAGRHMRGRHAGDRVPDAHPLMRDDGTSAHLFDLLRGPGHVLLLLADDQPHAWDTLLAQVHERYGERITAYLISPDGKATVPRATSLADPKGAIQHAFGASSPALYLIRPDGYIGCRSMSPDVAAVLEYGARVFGR